MKSILPLLVALISVLNQGVEAKSPVINDVQDFPRGFVRELQSLNKAEELSQKQLQNKLQDLLGEYEIEPKDHRKLLWFDALEMTVGEALLGTMKLVIDLATEDNDEEAEAQVEGSGFLSGLRFRDRTEENEEEVAAAVAGDAKASNNANTETRPIFNLIVRENNDAKNKNKNKAKQQGKNKKGGAVKGQGKRRNLRRGL